MKIVMKIGGSLYNEDLSHLYKDVKSLVDKGHKVAIVHGGGPQINQTLEAMGKEPKYLTSASGMRSRHTDAATRDAAVMALGGMINKGITASLLKHGISAIGISGVDGKLLVAKRKEKIIAIDPATNKRRVIRDEFSGKIIPEKTNGALLNGLLDAGHVPVVAALAIDESGEILNTDGDRAAASVCLAIGGNVLVSVTDVPGVLEDMENKRVIPAIKAASLDDIMEAVEGGMKKKVYAMKEAVNLGIPRLVITSGLVEGGVSKALDGECGTTITQ